MTIGLILAGGKSQRFQQDKALFWDQRYQKTWVELAYDKMFSLTSKVFISAQPDNFSKIQELALPKAKLILDPPEFSQRGPLSGFLAASLQAPTADFLILGIDYPHFSSENLKTLLRTENSYATTSSGQSHYTNAHLRFSPPQILTYLAGPDNSLRGFYKTLDLTPLCFSEESLTNYNYPFF